MKGGWNCRVGEDEARPNTAATGTKGTKRGEKGGKGGGDEKGAMETKRGAAKHGRDGDKRDEKGQQLTAPESENALGGAS